MQRCRRTVDSGRVLGFNTTSASSATAEVILPPLPPRSPLPKGGKGGGRAHHLSTCACVSFRFTVADFYAALMVRCIQPRYNEYFLLFGRLLGKAFLEDIPVTVRLSKLVLKALLGREDGALVDLEGFDSGACDPKKVVVLCENRRAGQCCGLAPHYGLSGCLVSCFPLRFLPLSRYISPAYADNRARICCTPAPNV